MTINQNTGVYTPAAGATSATPGQVVQSAVWDAIHTDMSNAFTSAVQMTQGTWGQRNIAGPNGGFEIWQRGAGASSSFSVGATTTQYTADRWYIATGANQASTVAAIGATTVSPGSRLAAKVTRNSGQTGTTAMVFGYPLDTEELIQLRGQIVALSFVMLAGANFSPTSGNMGVALNVGTGAPVKFSSGTYAGASTPISQTQAITTTATRYIFISTAVPTTAAQAEITFTWTPVGTAGADDSFTVDDVQLEVLVNATSPVAGIERWSFEHMLAACKRHYRKSFAYGTAPAQNAGLVGAAVLVEQAAVANCFWIQHSPISLRATGTYTSFNPAATNANANSNSAAATLAVSLDSVGVNSPDLGMIYVTSSGASAGAFVAIHWQADAGI